MPKLLLHTTILACLLTMFAVQAAPAASGDATTVASAEHLWMQAMQARDSVTLDRLVAPGFSLGGLDDLERAPVPRSVWIDNTLHHLRVTDVVFRALKVTVIGDVAVVRAVLRWRGSFDVEKFSDTSLLVDTWVRQGRSWVVVSRLVGEMPENPKSRK